MSKRSAWVLLSLVLTACTLFKPLVPNEGGAGRIAAEQLRTAEPSDPQVAELVEHNKSLRSRDDEEVMKGPAREGSGLVGEVDVDKALLPNARASKSKDAKSGGAKDAKSKGANGKTEEEFPSVRLDFVDAQLRSVVIAFMDFLKLPVSFQDSFKDRKVNLHFDARATRDELIPLFDAMLENYGVKLRYSSGIYYAGAADDKALPLQQPSPVGIGDTLGVFRLNFVDAREFLNLAKQVLRFPDRISILAGNAVVVNSTGNDVRAVQSLRDDVDIPAFAGKFVLIYAPRYLSGASLVALLDSALAQLSGAGQGTTKQFEAKQVPETERIVIVAANKTARDLLLQILSQSDVAGASYRRVFQYILGTQSAVDIVASLNLLVKSVVRSPAEINIVPDKMSNSLFVYASPEEYAEIRKLLMRMDFRPPAVHIDMVIAEVDLTNSMRYGVEWFLKRSGRWVTDVDTRLGFDIATTGGMAVGIVDAASNFAALQLVGNETSFSLLSSPKLVVRNGATARILVGSEQPVIKTKVNNSVTAGNANTVIEPEYKKIGLELEVTPYVSSSNEVRLVIKLKDTAITGNVLLAGDRYPILANRELTTDLVTSDGRPIFLGGIRRQDANDTATRIPGPGDLPVVGAAFRNKSVENSGSELIILATATVIRDQQGADIITQALINAAKQNMSDLRRAAPAAPAVPVVVANPQIESSDSSLRLQLDAAPNMTSAPATKAARGSTGPAAKVAVPAPASASAPAPASAPASPTAPVLSP